MTLLFSTLRAAAGLPAAHALQAGAVAHQRELFAILARITFVAFFLRLLAHRGDGDGLALQFHLVRDAAVARSVGMAVATVHSVPPHRQMFGEDRRLGERGHVRLFIHTFWILLILLHRIHAQVLFTHLRQIGPLKIRAVSYTHLTLPTSDLV